MYLEELVEGIESSNCEMKSWLNRENIKGLHDPSLPELSYASIPNGTAHDNKILRFCYPKARKISEVAAYLGIKDSNYFRKKILENLISNNYLDKSDNGRVTYLKTNPDAVTLL